jgi:DNA-binding IscR family transcriptional regulator
LSKSAAEITAADIYRAAEGDISPSFCSSTQHSGHTKCRRIDTCTAHLLWEQLSVSMTSYLNSITLQDLCNSANTLQARYSANEQMNNSFIKSKTFIPREI